MLQKNWCAGACPDKGNRAGEVSGAQVWRAAEGVWSV